MNIKNTCKYFAESFRQTKAIGITTAFLLALQVIVDIVVIVEGRHSNSYYEYIDLMAALVVVGIVIMPIMCIQLFGWLSSRGESDFYHSLPIKRSHMFTANIAAIIAWGGILLVGFYLIGLILIPIAEANGSSIATNNAIYYIFSIFTVGMMLVGAIAIAKCLTSSSIITFFVTLMILFAPRLFIVIIKLILIDVVPKAVFSGGPIWENGYNLLWHSLDEDFYFSWDAIIYSAALFIMYLLIAAYLFINRKSENAGKPAINRRVQAVLRLIPAVFICMVPIGDIIVGIERNDGVVSDEGMIIIMYIIAFASVFVYEVISTRRLVAVKNALSGLLALIVINIVLIFGILGYVNYLKDVNIDADNIDYVVWGYDDEVHYGEKVGGIEGRIFESPLDSMYMKEYAAKCAMESTSDDKPSGIPLVLIIKSKNDLVNLKVTANWDDIVLHALEEDCLKYIAVKDLVGVNSVGAYNYGDDDGDETLELYRRYYDDALRMGDEAFAKAYKDSMYRYYSYSASNDHGYDLDETNPVARFAVHKENSHESIFFYITEDFESAYEYYLKEFLK